MGARAYSGLNDRFAKIVRGPGIAALFAWLSVSGMAWAVEPVTYEDSQGNVISFQLGDSAFADSVSVYSPGDPAPNEDALDGELALGPPDYDEPGDGSYATLGCSGELVLQFTDNVVMDQPGPDLHVFEVGPDIEPTFVAISSDGENWLELGRIEGGRASLDISERAEAVRRYLVEELDLTEIDLSVRGAGESQPVATNETPEGRQSNRRVEFIF